MGSTRRLRVLGGLAVLALLVTGCSDDDDAAGSSDGGSEGDGGSAATGEPIAIGFHSLEGAAISFPDLREGFEQGIAYVNEELGGVDGRPIEAEVCKTDVTPESSIDCANQFVEDGVVTAVQGIDIAADAMIPVLSGAGVAEIGAAAVSNEVQTDVGHSFFLSPSTEGLIALAIQTVADEGAETVRFFATDDPNSRAVEEEIITPFGEALGVDAASIFYNPAAADWAALVAAAEQDDADAMGTPGSAEPDCTAMMSAIAQSGSDAEVFLGGCTAFLTELDGESVEGSYTFADLYAPDALDGAPAEKVEQVEVYEAWMEDAGAPLSPLSQVGFGLAVDVADILGQVEGDITAASVLETLPEVSGDRFMGDAYACDGTAWPGGTACSKGALVMRSTAEGGREVVGDGWADVAELAELIEP